MTVKQMVGLLIVVLGASPAPSAEYPNELEGFKLYDKYCHGLKPMRSTVEDVKKVLGTPTRDDSEADWRAIWFDKDTWHIWSTSTPTTASIRVVLPERGSSRLTSFQSSRFLSHKSSFPRHSTRPMSLLPMHNGTNTMTPSGSPTRCTRPGLPTARSDQVT